MRGGRPRPRDRGGRHRHRHQQRDGDEPERGGPHVPERILARRARGDDDHQGHREQGGERGPPEPGQGHDARQDQQHVGQERKAHVRRQLVQVQVEERDRGRRARRGHVERVPVGDEAGRYLRADQRRVDHQGDHEHSRRRHGHLGQPPVVARDQALQRQAGHGRHPDEDHRVGEQQAEGGRRGDRGQAPQAPFVLDARHEDPHGQAGERLGGVLLEVVARRASPGTAARRHRSGRRWRSGSAEARGRTGTRRRPPAWRRPAAPAAAAAPRRTAPAAAGTSSPGACSTPATG